MTRIKTPLASHMRRIETSEPVAEGKRLCWCCGRAVAPNKGGALRRHKDKRGFACPGGS